MKVKNLIEKLEKLNSNAEVKIVLYEEYYDNGSHGYGEAEGWYSKRVWTSPVHNVVDKNNVVELS